MCQLLKKPVYVSEGWSQLLKSCHGSRHSWPLMPATGVCSGSLCQLLESELRVEASSPVASTPATFTHSHRGSSMCSQTSYWREPV